MKDEKYILDTSALMCFIENEEGADEVEKILREENALLPWVALLEITYKTQQKCGESEAINRYAMVKNFPVNILWGMDEPTLLISARLKATYRLSFADSVIAAFAISNQAILVHKDPEFESLNEKMQMISLPFKRRLHEDQSEYQWETL